MRRVVLIALAASVSGCGILAPSPQDKVLMERVSELQLEVDQLKAENVDLRHRVDLLELREREHDGASSADDAGAHPMLGSSVPLTLRCTERDGLFHLDGKGRDVGDQFAGLAREVRIVPYFENGKAKGFKLFSIRPDSFVSSCGFRNGDVVASINGFEMTSPDKALDAYTKLKDGSRWNVAIVREGKPANVVIDAN